MGVLGLTTYIASDEGYYLNPYKLHDCILIVDGNNAACQIYGMSKCNHAFGGDYDKYSHRIKQFVKLLRRCNITPYFIFDGGYEQRKLRTVVERLRVNIQICGHFRHKYRQSKCLPLLMKQVFCETVRQLNVPIFQCNLEADNELVILARTLKCPILSYDSDFLVADVMYIPFPSLELALKNLPGRKNEFYLSCKIYNVDVLLDRFGGLRNKSLLPLLSCLIGNDYLGPGTFRHFLNVPPNASMPSKLKSAIQWLKSVSSTNEAMRQMLCFATNKRKVKNILEVMVEEFNSTESEFVSAVLPLIYDQSQLLIMEMEKLKISEDDDDEADLIVLDKEEFDYCYALNDESLLEYYKSENPGFMKTLEENHENTSKNENLTINYIKHNQMYKTIELSNQDSSNLDDSKQYEPHDKIPEWLSKNIIMCLLPPTALNILNLRKVFIHAQSEDYSMKPAHEISLPILEIISAILLIDDATNTKSVKCYGRIRSSILGIYDLKPNYESILSIETLKSIPQVDIKDRLNIICNILNNEEILNNLDHFPSDWKLFLISIVYWSKRSIINDRHIKSIIVCLIYLNVIDERTNYSRSVNNNGKSLKIKNSVEIGPCDKSIIECIKGVSKIDCIIVSSILVNFHNVDHRILSDRKSFNPKIVHEFAQLQSCMENFMLLNSILNFPFSQIKVYRFFSGTFLYNIYNYLNCNIKNDLYKTIFGNCKSLIILYKSILQSFNLYLFNSHDNNNINCVKNKRKKKRKKKSTNNDNVEVKLELSDEEEGTFLPDKNNIYTFLRQT